MFAVAHALDMAVDLCECVSGTVVTKARIKMPGAAERIKKLGSDDESLVHAQGRECVHG